VEVKVVNCRGRMVMPCFSIPMIWGCLPYDCKILWFLERYFELLQASYCARLRGLNLNGNKSLQQIVSFGMNLEMPKKHLKVSAVKLFKHTCLLL
jgi:hypothetical protein